MIDFAKFVFTWVSPDEPPKIEEIAAGGYWCNASLPGWSYVLGVWKSGGLQPIYLCEKHAYDHAPDLVGLWNWYKYATAKGILPPEK